MKRIFVFSVLLFLLAKLPAQTWAPTGVTWHYSFSQLMSYGYLEIDCIYDTIILGKECKTFQKTQFGYTFPGVYDTVNLGKEYTYLDSNSNIVYRYFDNKFDTLYNFNAQIGDVWKVHGLHVSTDSGTVLVDSIGYRVINSDTLKSIFVSTIDGSCIGWYSAEIVERIGCINDYMFPNYVSCIADLGEGGPLRCYSDEYFPIFITGESSYCDFITSIDSFVSTEDYIEIYPNPTSSNIIIRRKNMSLTDVKIVLFSSSNQKVFEYELNLTKDFQIDMGDLKSGLYFLQVTNDKGVFILEKVIKQ